MIVSRGLLTLVSTVLGLAMMACQSDPPASQPLNGPDRHFTLVLTPGSEYQGTSWWYVFPIAIYPQVACWVETPRGDLVGTLYVTPKAAKKTWVSAPDAGRPEALPVWSHRTGTLDGIASATPSGVTEAQSSLAQGLPEGEYVIKLEVNRSYDYNQTYTRDTSGVGGQPSLVYEGRIVVGPRPSHTTLRPVGTGSPDGSNGAIQPGLEGMTSALALLKSCEVGFEP